jgi:hypothetical protein
MAGDTASWFVGVRPEPPPLPPRLRSAPPPPPGAVRHAPPAPRLMSFDKLPTIDTGVVILKAPMSDRTKLALLGGAAVALVLAVVVGLTSGPDRAPLPAAIVAAPAAAMVAAPSPTPSVRRTLPANRSLSVKRRVRARHRHR